MQDEAAAQKEPVQAGVALLSFLGAAFIRALRTTLRLRFHGDGEVRRRERSGEPFILCFWHRHLLLMPYAYRGRRIHVLSSRSRDGEIIAGTLARLGIKTIRGSSTRGGAMALRGMVQVATQGSDLGFTPDGPRGPAGEVKPGVLQAAALSGLPIVPVAYAATRFGRLKSWDRTEVPLPFSRLHFVYAAPLTIERGADLAIAAERLQDELNQVGAEATRRARGELVDA